MTNNPPTEAFVTALSVALRILSTRALAFLALLMSFALACWALWAQTWIAFTSATTFAILAYLPALWSTRGTP